MKSSKHAGGCHCGAVRYEISGPIRNVVVCHCRECQRLNGGIGAHSRTANDHLNITEQKGLAWYQISDHARRGYCRECGSPLFWQLDSQPSTGIVVGSLDDSSSLKTIGHIFVSEKSRYYEITDGLPRFEQSSEGDLPGDFV